MSTRLPAGLSHMIAVQAGRFVGVSHVAVGRRILAGTLPSVDVFGVTMIPITPLRIWKREILRAERKRQKEREQGLCPKCDAEMDGADSSSHLCPDKEAPEPEDVFRADN